MKKTLLKRISLCIALTLMLLPLQLFARDFSYTYEGKTITYTVIDEDAKTCTTKLGSWTDGNRTAGNNVSRNLILPEHPKDGDVEFTLVSIGEYAFLDCSDLTSITIPNSVTSIGGGAFYGCSSLQKAEFASIESLCNIGFENKYSNPLSNAHFNNAHHLYINGEEVTELVIPNSVESIGQYAFYYCEGLTSVSIPNSVTSIGNDAFSYCIALQKAEFASIESLCNIRFEGTASNPLSYAHHLYINGEEVTELVIPNSFTSIGVAVFSGCSGLTSITIPNSVTSIGIDAFSGCSGLTSITIPNSVTSIGGWAFSGCSGLTSISIPNSVTSISNYTFSGCSGLTSFTIPNFITSIGRGAFNGCFRLKELTFEDGDAELFLRENAMSYDDDSRGEGLFYNCPLEKIYLGRNLSYYSQQSYGYSPFYTWKNCLTDLTIGSTVTSIDQYAFYYCKDLALIKCLGVDPPSISNSTFSESNYNSAILDIPNNNNTIVQYLSSKWKRFKNLKVNSQAVSTYNDDVLNYLLIPDSENPKAMIISGDYSNLTSVSIPERFTVGADSDNPIRYYVTAIGPGAFNNCKQLSEVSFNSRSIIEIIGDSAFYYCKDLISVSIPNSVTSIGKSAFEKCYSLTSISIPNSVTSIGYDAFYSCSALQKAEFASIEALCNIKFGRGSSNPLGITQHLYINGEEVTDLVIPNSVESIGDYAFEYCIGLTSVSIPNSVTSIGYDAFSNCYGLGKADFASIESLCNIRFEDAGSNPLSNRNAHHLYINGEEVTDLVIPNSVESIGQYAFCYCKGLTSVSIPNSVTSIGQKAFSVCSGLTSVKIPNSVTSIGNFAFDLCEGISSIEIEDGSDPISLGIGWYTTNLIDLYIGRNFTWKDNEIRPLTNLTIGNLVSKIPESAFANYVSIKSLKLGSGLTSIGDNAFSGCTGLEEVIIPENVESIGASAFANIPTLASIIMGHSVKSIGEKAFDGAVASTVSITAQEPPVAPNNAFSNYNGKLYVQGEGTADKYYDAYTCWDRFDNYVMIVAEKMEGNNEKIITGKPGQQVQLVAKLWPENVTLPQVFWRSTNPEIATVDNNGLVTFHADSEEIGTRSGASCKIIAETLYAEGPVLEFNLVSSEGEVLPEAINLNETSKDLTVGETFKLIATVTPDDATDKTVSWASADASVASVDDEGNVTALKLGETVITASCGSVSATCKVTVIPTLVESLSIQPTEWTGNEGETFTITATVLPEDATDKTIEWISSDTTIAEVDAEGNVTVKKDGTCKIIVSTTDGSNLSAECVITSTSGISDILIDANEPFDVYNMSGLLIRENTNNLDELAPGLYIIRQGSKARKITIM